MPNSDPVASAMLVVFVTLLLPSPDPESGLLRPVEGLSVNGSHVNLLSVPPGYEPRTYPDPERDNGGNPTM